MMRGPFFGFDFNPCLNAILVVLLGFDFDLIWEILIQTKRLLYSFFSSQRHGSKPQIPFLQEIVFGNILILVWLKL